MSQDLTDREIRTRFETMAVANGVAHEAMSEKLDKILEQTTKTNGKVLRLQEWKSYLVGAWAVVTLFVIPLVLYVNAVESNYLDKQIQQIKGDVKGLLDKF
jgi:hypothetical protein